MTDSILDLDTASLADEGVWCHLEHPATGEPLFAGGGAVRVRLLGTDGHRFRLLRRQVANRRLGELLRAQETGDEEAQARLEHELEVELAARATLGWENLWLPDGAPLAFSHEAARRLYGERGWILDQVSRFVADRANFLSASRRG